MFGGVCVDMSKMDAITDYHLEDFDVKVQPGVTREGLNHHIRNDGKGKHLSIRVRGYRSEIF